MANGSRYLQQLQLILQTVDAADITLQTKQMAIDAAIKHAFHGTGLDAVPGERSSSSLPDFDCVGDSHGVTAEPPEEIDLQCGAHDCGDSIIAFDSDLQDATARTEADRGSRAEVDSLCPFSLGEGNAENLTLPPRDDPDAQADEKEDARETPSEPPTRNVIIAVLNDDAQETPSEPAHGDMIIAVLDDDAQETPSKPPNGDQFIATLNEDHQETPAEPPDGNVIIADACATSDVPKRASWADEEDEGQDEDSSASMLAENPSSSHYMPFHAQPRKARKCAAQRRIDKKGKQRVNEVEPTCISMPGLADDPAIIRYSYKMKSMSIRELHTSLTKSDELQSMFADSDPPLATRAAHIADMTRKFLDRGPA